MPISLMGAFWNMEGEKVDGVSLLFSTSSSIYQKEAKNVAFCKKFQAGSAEYNASCQTVTGEASATTMYLHRGWLREQHEDWPLPRVMAALQPSAKLIAFLREPGARFLSEHK